jgi:putative alpha-1,2-mannosidase
MIRAHAAFGSRKNVMSFWLALGGLLLGSISATHGKEPVDEVDPLIDSAHSRWIFFSSASRPFAMVNLSPDTNAEAAWNSGYCYHKGSLCGFSHIHAWELGGVSMMPVNGDVDPTAGPQAFRSAFRHDDEVCQAGYHAVTLDRYQIRVELTSTRRAGFHRYRFAGSEGRVAFNLAGEVITVPVPEALVRQSGDAEVEGYQVDGPTPSNRRSKPCNVYFDWTGRSASSAAGSASRRWTRLVRRPARTAARSSAATWAPTACCT